MATDLFEIIFQVLLVFLRVGTMWMALPILGQANIPTPVRLAGGLTLSMALLPMVASQLPKWSLLAPPELPELVVFITREVLFGIGLGLAARMMFFAAVAAAQWVGVQMGFAMGGLLNPELNQSDSAWAEFNNWLFIMTFLAIGGHLLLIQAMADSYTFSLTNFFARVSDPAIAGAFWIEMGSQFFIWMLKLSGPLLVVLLILQAAMGIISRFIPQINVWFVSIPLTLGIGVFFFTLLSPVYGDALHDLAAFTLEASQGYLRFVGTR